MPKTVVETNLPSFSDKDALEGRMKLEILERKLDDRIDEIFRINKSVEMLANSNQKLDEKIQELNKVIDQQSEVIKDSAAQLDAKDTYLKKLATGNFGIAKRTNGKIVVINPPEFKDFLAVQATKELSLYEAAVQIFDLEIANKATEAIGKANTERNEVALMKMKDRVIHILQTQKKGN